MVQGEVALVVEMALRAYPTVHWLSGRLNSGFECIKRFSPQATQTQLNCLRNTHFFNASLQKMFTLTIGQCVHFTDHSVEQMRMRRTSCLTLPGVVILPE